MIVDILRFMASPWFSIPFQIFMCYAWYRVGRRKEMLRAAIVFRHVDAQVGEIRKALTIKDAHIAALTAQLEEARAK